MKYKEAQQKADKLYKKVRLNKFTTKKRSRIIAIQHEDGSYLEFHSAFFRKLDNEWLVVVTENHGVFFYHFEYISWIKEFDKKIL